VGMWVERERWVREMGEGGELGERKETSAANLNIKRARVVDVADVATSVQKRIQVSVWEGSGGRGRWVREKGSELEGKGRRCQ
jgi:hypothetical protein